MDADTLRSRRLRAGLSQEALARLAGVALLTIARIENGRTIARPLTVARLAAALDAAPSLAEQARAKLRSSPPPDAPSEQCQGGRVSVTRGIPGRRFQ